MAEFNGGPGDETFTGTVDADSIKGGGATTACRAWAALATICWRAVRGGTSSTKNG